jgi:hypothetical protein
MEHSDCLLIVCITLTIGFFSLLFYCFTGNNLTAARNELAAYSYCCQINPISLTAGG